MFFPFAKYLLTKIFVIRYNNTFLILCHGKNFRNTLCRIENRRYVVLQSLNHSDTAGTVHSSTRNFTIYAILVPGA